MRTKVTSLMIAVVLITIAAISVIAWFTTESILRAEAFDRLVSVREDRKDEIEQYFKTLRNELILLTKDETVLNGMQEFSDAFAGLNANVLLPNQEAVLNTYYEDVFLPALEANLRQDLSAEIYRPKSNAASYLQYHYLAVNPNEVGEKYLLDQAEDGSMYSVVHAHYHPFLRTFVELFQYYDLFLIDAQSREIVYTVFKEPDFGSNLIDDPYATSGLAQVVDLILTDPEPGRIDVIDFSSYEPSYLAPAAFFGAPLYVEEQLIGVLVIQAPIDEIDSVMTSGRKWREHGMGESGETYLVGADYLMRSTSRFLVEDKVGYLDALRSSQVDQSTINLIANLDTSILHQEVKTQSTESAVAGESGIHIIDDYRNVSVLSAYAPLEVPGLDWVILAEIDVAEIMEPVLSQQQFFLIGMGGVIVFLLLLSFVAANLLTRPIHRLITGQKQVASGDLETLVPVRSVDEIGQLTASFNDMVGSLRQQQETLKEHMLVNERLLLSIMPAPIAARYKNGEQDIAEPIGEVTILFAHLRGVYGMSERLDDEKQVIEKLSELSAHLDTAANELDVARQPTVSNRYSFTCGLSQTPSNHTERILQFALAMRHIISEFNQRHGTRLVAQIGIHTGDVLGSVSQSRRFRFDLWGPTVGVTDVIETAAEPDEVLVSHEVYTKLRLSYDFAQHDSVRLENGNIWRVWRLVPPAMPDETDGADETQTLFTPTDVPTLPISLKPRRRRLWRRFAKVNKT